MKKAFLQLHIAVFLAGFTAILGKLILLNEAMLVWYRLVLTVIILLGVLFYKRQFIKLSLRDSMRIGFVGLIIAFHWVTFYGSVKYGTVSVALVCLSAAGFFSAILEPIILRKRIVLAELFLGTLAIIGIYIIFDFHPQYSKGIIFGIIAALGSAIFPILNKQLLHEFNPRILTFYELGVGVVFFSLFLPIYLHYFPAEYYLPTVGDWFWLLILAGVCTVVCFDLQLNALKHISAFTTNLSYNLEPIYGIILAFVFFDEVKLLNKGFYVGLFLILGAIVIQMVRVLWLAKRKV